MTDGIRILFLDVDNPLRPHGCRPSDGPWASERDGVCPARLARLNDLSDVPGLRIVVSSAWRTDPTTPAALVRQGLLLRFHDDWRTTTDVPGPDRPIRSWQISRWLQGRDVGSHYAILDDVDDFSGRHRRHVVMTDPFEGLTDDHVTRLRDLLTDRTPKVSFGT